MTLFKKKNPDAIAALEAELAALRRRRSDLETRHERLAFDLTEAEQARKAALLDDGDGAEKALTAASAHYEATRSSLDGVVIVIAETDAKIVTLEEEIALGKSRAQREAQAREDEAKRARAEALYSDYLAISSSFAEAMQAIEGDFSSQEIGGLVARVANDVAGARASWGVGLDRRVAALRADPPRRPAQPEPKLSEQGSGSFHSGFEPASAYGADRRPREPIWS